MSTIIEDAQDDHSDLSVAPVVDIKPAFAGFFIAPIFSARVFQLYKGIAGEAKGAKGVFMGTQKAISQN